MPLLTCHGLADYTHKPQGGGEDFLGGCATGTLEPLAYTRASSSEFCYPILD